MQAGVKGPSHEGHAPLDSRRRTLSTEPRQDLPIPLPVRLRLPGGELRTEYAVNLSPGGLCLHLADPIPVGTELELAFELPPARLRVQTCAKVVWSGGAGEGDAPGRLHETGICFGELDPELRQRLHRFAEQPRDRRR